MRRIWIHKVYIYICSYYLSNKNNEIQNLEYILMLMQVENLRKFGMPFFNYKIYINQDEVRIEYLSDLLRVSPIIDFSYEGFYLSSSMNIYLKMFKKYKKLEISELKSKVMDLVEGDLNNKYFVHKQYKNEKMRKMARLKINDETKSIFKKIIRKLIGVFSFGLLITPILVYPMLEKLEEPYDTQVLPIIFLWGVILGGIWCLWTWKWMQPTLYEKEVENRGMNNG